MARMPRLWRWKDNANAWYAYVRGKRVRLADPAATESEAMIALARVMAGVADTPDLQAGEVVTQFLEHCVGRAARGELARDTLRFYRERLALFAKACGRVSVAALRPSHVMAWLDGNPAWGSTYRAGNVTAVKAAFNWARRMGLVDTNPIAGMPKPRPRRTQSIPDHAGLARALAACASREFALLLRVVFATGCRKSEALRLEARDIDWGRALWHRAGKSTHATGKERVVHLPADVLAELAERARACPDGPLLRNTEGRPWTDSAINSQLRRIRKRAGGVEALTIQSLRHLFVSDALERGVPIATVAELVGHASTAMISRTYSHLSERHEHLKQALDAIRPRSEPAAIPSPPPPSPPAASPSASPPPSPAAARKPRRRPT